MRLTQAHQYSWALSECITFLRIFILSFRLESTGLSQHKERCWTEWPDWRKLICLCVFQLLSCKLLYYHTASRWSICMSDMYHFLQVEILSTSLMHYAHSSFSQSFFQTMAYCVTSPQLSKKQLKRICCRLTTQKCNIYFCPLKNTWSWTLI